MKKIKEIFLNVSSNIKDVVKKYPITLIIVAAITLFASICMEQDWMDEDRFWDIVLFGVIFGIETFWAETYTTKIKIKIIGTLISGAIAGAAVWATNIWEDNSIEVGRILFGYVAVVFVMTIYKILRESKLKLEEYFLKVFANTFSMSIVYGILNTGVLAVLAIFCTLLLSGDYSHIFQRAVTMLFGLFFIPSLIYSVCEVNNKETRRIYKRCNKICNVTTCNSSSSNNLHIYT